MKLKMIFVGILLILITTLKAALDSEISINFNLAEESEVKVKLNQELQKNIVKDPDSAVFFRRRIYQKNGNVSVVHLNITTAEIAENLKDNEGKLKEENLKEHTDQWEKFYNVIYKNEKVDDLDQKIEKFRRYANVYVNDTTSKRDGKGDKIKTNSFNVKKEKYKTLYGQKFYTLQDIKYILDEYKDIEKNNEKIEEIMKTGAYFDPIVFCCALVTGMLTPVVGSFILERLNNYLQMLSSDKIAE